LWLAPSGVELWNLAVARFHRINTVIQTVSQSVIAIFCIWIAVSLLHCSHEASKFAGELPRLDKFSSLDSPKDSGGSTAFVVPPSLPAPRSPVVPSSPRFDYNAELRRIEQERKWQQQREDEEQARRNGLPNGVRQK
jgi:hypothetical protein